LGLAQPILAPDHRHLHQTSARRGLTRFETFL
ncbi:MAG: hypothetical protein AVDCRST_MAG78-6, partial [uncultured Rubrobacteraceae bacterium]